MKSKFFIFVTLLMVVAILAACAPSAAPTPETIIETVEVEKEVVVTEVVEKEVIVTEEVEVAPPPEALPYEGVEVDVLTFTGPQIAEPLQRRGPDFEALTGAKVNVTIVPFSDLYQKILTDAATGTNAFDAWVFAPQWMVDYIVPGYVENLSEYVANDPDL